MEQNAEYQISSSINGTILEITLTGAETQNTYRKMQNEIANIIIKSRLRKVLMDCRDLKERLGITETYERVRSYPPEIYKVRFALVDLTENSGYQNFHETTAINAGMQFKWFTDADDAKTWLMGK